MDEKHVWFGSKEFLSTEATAGGNPSWVGRPEYGVRNHRRASNSRIDSRQSQSDPTGGIWRDYPVCFYSLVVAYHNRTHWERRSSDEGLGPYVHHTLHVIAGYVGRFEGGKLTDASVVSPTHNRKSEALRKGTTLSEKPPVTVLRSAPPIHPSSSSYEDCLRRPR